tara:strand:+ start:155 stop:727 length:573 start_codon:yes stop_codon:yes gene_type:complete
MKQNEANKLTTDEIMLMCDKLSNKYYRYNMKNDIVSEGIMAIYERLSTVPDDEPAYLYRRAAKAMHDFVNLKSGAVDLPVNPTTRAMARGKLDNLTSYSEKGLDNIEDALQTSIPFEEAIFDHVNDCTKAYENKDLIEKGMKLLNDREKDIIKARYFEGVTQCELANTYGVTQQAVSLWEDEALCKMSKV